MKTIREEVKEVLQDFTVCNGTLAIKVPTETEGIKEILFGNATYDIITDRILALTEGRLEEKLSPITVRIIENEINSKKKMLTDFQNPEYIKSQGMVSRDEIPVEDKIKFMVNTLKFEISCLEKDLSNQNQKPKEKGNEKPINKNQSRNITFINLN